MFRKFKEFWTSYWDLCGVYFKWLKAHWIGLIILTCVLMLLECTIVFWDSITEWFKEKFHKDKENNYTSNCF